MSREMSLSVVQHVLGPYYCLAVLKGMSPHWGQSSQPIPAPQTENHMGSKDGNEANR